MSELRLFAIESGKTQECAPAFFKLERELQSLFEANLESLLGIRFVASEFSTNQGGRIDTLGIDENGFAVVIEYKLDKDKTVINQGMSYMAWLRSHKEALWKLVFEKLGRDVADSIDHTSTRLICIATEFTRDDLGAYELMPNNIDLVRYRRFGGSHLILERVTSSESSSSVAPGKVIGKVGTDKAISQVFDDADETFRQLFASLKSAIMELGDDVTEKWTKVYVAYKRTRNFASIVASPRNSQLFLYLHLNPDSVQLEPNMRDVREINHWGTGKLEVKIRNDNEIGQVKPLLERAYEGES